MIDYFYPILFSLCLLFSLWFPFLGSWFVTVGGIVFLTYTLCFRYRVKGDGI